MNQRRAILWSLLAVVACGGDRSRDGGADSGGATATTKESPEEFRRRQQAFADSVLNTTNSTKDVVERLGTGYAIGSVRLRDTVAMLAAKANCFQTGRATDPYLAGTVSMFVHVSVIGSDVVRVQESNWTSIAGNLVDACLNEESRKWKFDATFGKPSAYIVQVQFK